MLTQKISKTIVWMLVIVNEILFYGNIKQSKALAVSRAIIL